MISSSEVWATSINSLNDSEEFAHGIRLLEEQLSLALKSRHVHPAQKLFMENVSTSQSRARKWYPSTCSALLKTRIP